MRVHKEGGRVMDMGWLAALLIEVYIYISALVIELNCICMSLYAGFYNHHHHHHRKVTQVNSEVKSTCFGVCLCWRAEVRSGGTDLQGQIGVLLFLPHLEAGKVGVFELQAVLLFEILSHSALHGLAIF